MKTINGAPFIAVQPSTVSTKRNEVCERCIGVVPHDEDEENKVDEGHVGKSDLSVSTGLSVLCTPTRRYRVTVLTETHGVEWYL